MIQNADWETLEPSRWSSLGVRGAKHPRTATPLPSGEQLGGEQAQTWKVVLQRLSDILLLAAVVEEFKSSQIETLVVVPITVKEPHIDVRRVRAVLFIGVAPFAAIPVGGKDLINRISVIMSPGFFSFAGAPELVREKYANRID
ncbi:MAG TPA: hypothetical protein DD706_24440 [Nitrospiraceae bacterium]|nr:hypothetical protein [Nitrospiraceae bacterium]